MSNDLARLASFSAAEELTKGVDTNKSDFDIRLRYTKQTKNLTTGINEGVGPRYGVAPIPGHATTELPSAPTTDFAGLVLSEAASPGTANFSLSHRIKLFGIAKISFGSTADINTKVDMYVWIIGHDQSGTLVLDAVFNADQSVAGSSGVTQLRDDFFKGLGVTNYLNSSATSTSNVCFEYFPKNGTVDNSYNSFLGISSSLNKLAFSTISVSGKRYSFQWFVGRVITDPTNTATGIPNFFQAIHTSGALSSFPRYGGISPQFVYGNFKKGNRSLYFFNLNEDYQLIRSYVYDDYNVVGGGSPTYVSLPYDPNSAGMNVSGNATYTQDRWDGATGTSTWVNSNTAAILVNDPDLTIDSSYKAILIAANKAYALVLQDWRRSTQRFNQWMDLTRITRAPNSQTTLADVDGTNITAPYTESFAANAPAPVATCFANFPPFIFGTALKKVSAGLSATQPQQVALGAANSGVLRANTVYEFTYSIFDKRLGFESNVGVPAKFQTDAEDFVAVTVYNDLYNSGASRYMQQAAINLGRQTIDSGNDQYIRTNMDLNYLEARFYYREWGTDTWLPALFIDMAKLFFYPDAAHLYACTGDARGLPGGTTGGVVDHSPLPDDVYTSVLSYRNRAFWFSKTSMRFSAFDNIFEYPIRNAVPIPQGEYRGGLPHVYPGQAEQSSRLLIYGTREIYVGRFTGNVLTRSVQLDQDNSIEVQLDGSDFAVDSWTTNTAFSYRSAVIAEGIHYYWGPQGVYRDDGVNQPVKISGDFEPDIFKLYDSSAVDDICCVYSAQTKEIIWFYPQLGGDGTKTGLLIFDFSSQGFYLGEIDCKIDSVQKLEVIKDTELGGDRTLIITRADGSSSVQRAQFFDFNSRSGDMTNGKEMLVKSVSTPSTGVRRFTLASGYDAGLFAGISVGDLIATDEIEAYTDGALTTNILVKIVAKGAGTLDFLLPDGAVFPPTTLAVGTFFPLYVEGIHDFAWVADFKYWIPAGPLRRFFWEYLFVILKLDSPYTVFQDYVGNGDLENTTPLEFSVSYRSPTSPDFLTDTLHFEANSDGNSQLLHNFDIGDENIDGAGIKIRLSGTHLAYKWVLQYLTLFAEEIQPDLMKFQNRGERGNGI